jgi:AhpD family alkylhydroperoxidase
MQARIANPAMLFPEVIKNLQAAGRAVESAGVAEKTLNLVHLRASQINGCGVCVDMHWRLAKKVGETDERLVAVAAWHDAPYFTEAERAVLALTEAGTRLSDRSDPVPDEIWDEAARHYNERQLAAIVLHIGMINLWNRLNVTTRQVAGEWIKSAEAKKWVEAEVAAR